MRWTIIAALLLFASVVRAETNAPLRQVSSSDPTITLSGGFRALHVIDKKEVTVRWRQMYTLEQIIRDMGGFADLSVEIIVVDAQGNARKFGFNKEFKNDKAVREMKIQPGMHIRVRHLVE